MFTIKTMNNISPVIFSCLPAEKYAVDAAQGNPAGLLVRSADLHNQPFNKNLLGIARAGAGVNNIPIDECSKKGIVVFNTPGANANAVAELVIAGLLIGSRKIAQGIIWASGLKGQGDAVPQLVEKGKSAFAGPELHGKTLGVIGLGAIGALVANAAIQGLGMNVIGYDPFISVENAWHLSSGVHRANGYDEILKESDYVTIHIPLNDKTKNTFNSGLLSRMKDGAHLLNFSRGEICCANDIKNALETGKLSSYVTDFPCDTLLQVPGCVCIPHLGASTPESEDNCALMAARQLADYLSFGSIRNSVNLPDLPLKAPESARVLVIHKNIPNMLAAITGCISAEGINLDMTTNKSRNDLAITVMEMQTLPSGEAIQKLEALDGVIRVRTF